MAVFSPVVDSFWSLTCVCAKLASAMQSIKGFSARRLCKTECCPATLGAIQSRPVQRAARWKHSWIIEFGRLRSTGALHMIAATRSDDHQREGGSCLHDAVY